MVTKESGPLAPTAKRVNGNILACLKRRSLTISMAGKQSLCFEVKTITKKWSSELARRHRGLFVVRYSQKVARLFRSFLRQTCFSLAASSPLFPKLIVGSHHWPGRCRSRAEACRVQDSELKQALRRQYQLCISKLDHPRKNAFGNTKTTLRRQLYMQFVDVKDR